MRPRHEDTMINAPLLNEWQGKYGLAYCANLAHVEAKKSAIIEQHIRAKFPEATAKNYMGYYWRLAGDDPVAVEYGAGDGTTTWQLRDWQMGQIEEQELTKVWDIESRLIPVLARMSLKGVRIDEEKLHKLHAELTSEIEQLMGGFPADFNPRSGADLEKWFTDKGVTDWPLTAALRKPSFPEAWLETNEPGQQIIKVRKLMTLDNSFVQPMIDHHVYNGRVHTSFNQLRSDEFGTVTGRLSSSDPNLQQVPKRNQATGRRFREVFIPDEGMLWGSDDYSQMEPRLLAFYAHCKVLLDGYNSNPEVDAHTSVTRAMYNWWDALDKSDPQKKFLRENGKRVNQTLITGGGKNALIHRYKMTDAEAQHLMRNYFDSMPEIRVLQKEAAAVMRKRGYIKSLLGRRARLLDPNKDYTAVNRLLQVGNADAIKLKMVQIDDYLESEGRPPLDILVNIHDALESQFSKDAWHHRNKVLEIMQDFGPDQPIHIPGLPIRVEPGVGANWGDATYGPIAPKDREMKGV